MILSSYKLTSRSWRLNSLILLWVDAQFVKGSVMIW